MLYPESDDADADNLEGSIDLKNGYLSHHVRLVAKDPLAIYCGVMKDICDTLLKLVHKDFAGKNTKAVYERASQFSAYQSVTMGQYSVRRPKAARN